MAQSSEKNPIEAFVGSSEERADDWHNTLTGLGMATRDKRMSSAVSVDYLTHSEIDELVEADDMASRIVQTLPEDMMREGWQVCIEGDPEAEEAVMAKIDELEFNARMQDGLEDARAHGGAGLLMGVMDGQKDLSKPLDVNRIQDVEWLTALPCNELIPANWYDKLAEPSYGTPSIYQIVQLQFGTENFLGNLAAVGNQPLPLVHESRLLKFHGVRLSRRRTRQKRGWGGSVLTSCWSVIRDFQTSWAGAALLLQDFSQAVMRLKGLTEAKESGNEAAIIKRAQLIDMSRSIARCVLLDEDEEFERKATPMGGMPEMLQQFAVRLSAAARMPVTKLMGQAPAGLNATGESDIRFWYDHVKAAQVRKAQPIINRFLKLLFLAKNGPTKGVEPDNWSIKFNSQYQMTDAEQADIRLKCAQADALWVTNQVLQPYEVAVARFGGDTFGLDIQIDTTDREALLASDQHVVPGAPQDPNVTGVGEPVQPDSPPGKRTTVDPLGRNPSGVPSDEP